MDLTGARLLVVQNRPGKLHISATFADRSESRRVDDGTPAEIAKGETVYNVSAYNAEDHPVFVLVAVESDGQQALEIDGLLLPGESLLYERGFGWQRLSPHRERYVRQFAGASPAAAGSA